MGKELNTRLILSLVLFVSLSGVWSQGQHKRLNLELVRRDTQVFESIMNEVLEQNFTTPFAISASPKGTYLQDYGIIFSFQLNINRGTIRLPYGEFKATKAIARRSKEEQILLLNETMIRCMADYGNTIKQLGGQDRISISAHVQDRNELDRSRDTVVVVFTVSRDDIDLFALKKISFRDFKDRVSVVKY